MWGRSETEKVCLLCEQRGDDTEDREVNRECSIVGREDREKSVSG